MMKKIVLAALMLTVVTCSRAEQKKTTAKIEGGVVITTTALKAVPGAGWQLLVEVAPGNGFLPQTLTISAGPNLEDIHTLENGPYDKPQSVEFDLECNLGPGVIEILVHGFDADRAFAGETTQVTLDAPGELVRLQVKDVTFRDSTPEQRLEVLGWYGDCDLPRDVTAESRRLATLAQVSKKTISEAASSRSSVGRRSP